MINKLKRRIVLMLIILLIFPSNLVSPLIVVNADEETVIFHETFDEDDMLFIQSGGASLAYVSDVDFTDNGHALHVYRRMNDYDAADLPFLSLGLKDRRTYSVQVEGYVDSDEEVPNGAEVVISLVDSYTWIKNLALEAGEAFSLSTRFTADFSTDNILRIQTNESGAKVAFYITEVLIKELHEDSSDQNDTERGPIQLFETITFENGELSGFEPRGGVEKLTITNEVNNTVDGSTALKVENREQNWNGPSLRIEKFIEKGSEYHLSAWVKLLEPSSAEITLSTQVGSEDYGASYMNIQSKTVAASDGWVELEGTYRYSSVGDEYVTLYIESANPEASFYIDDISLVKTNVEKLEVEQNLVPIKEVYQDYFLIGNAVSTSDFDGDRLALLTGHHNLVTAENAMKPDSAYINGHFDFNAEDMLIQMAEDQGLAVHGHVLVWHQQSPEWL